MDDIVCLRDQVLANAKILYPHSTHQHLVVRKALSKTGHAKRPAEWMALLVNARPKTDEFTTLIESRKFGSIKEAYANLLEEMGEMVTREVKRVGEIVEREE